MSVASEIINIKQNSTVNVIQASAVQRAGSSIQWIKSVASGACYQPDSDLSVGWSYPLFEQLGPQ